jgi:hypothetical protein
MDIASSAASYQIALRLQRCSRFDRPAARADNSREQLPRETGMPIVYVARSPTLQKWGGEVGVTKHLFKIGVADDAEAAVKALNDSGCAGASDWKLLVKEATEVEVDEDKAIERLAVREKMVDPNLYPRLKGERGVVKVKPANVENHLMVKKALAGDDDIAIKVTPAVIGAYLIANALR